MPAQQQQINYGNTANDGQGDPLRTAFIKTDDNFDAIWNAGPVGSNVTILNNTVLAVNANGNLTISANGIGVIETRSTLVPRFTNANDLGSANLRYRSVYIGSGGGNIAGNLQVTGSTTFSTNVTVGGNLTVQGDVIQLGNITTDSKTVQLANTAVTDAAADGSGVTVGANDDIATLLYNSALNEWRTNIGANVAGNVTANYFIGNGALLTGVTSYANADAVAYGEAGWAGNIIPGANGVYSLGNSTNYWSNLWVANNTIYIGGVPLGIAGNVLTVNGEAVLSNDSDSSITTTGNLSAGNILATGNMDAQNLVVTNIAEIGDISIAGGYITLVDGSASTGIDISPNAEGQAFLQVPNDDTANTANLRVVNNAGNVRIETNAGNIWTFGYNGDLTAPGNVAADAILTDNYFYANGEPFVSSSTGNITFTNTTMSPPDGEDLFITAANSEVEITGQDFRVEVTDDVRIQGNDIVSIRNTSNNEAITIRTDYNGNDYSWEFDATGNLITPGNIEVSGDITVAGQITGTSSASTLVLAAEPDSNTAIQLNDTVDSVIRTVANLEVRTDSSNTARTWQFDTNGDLTVPNYINFKDGTFIGDEGGAGTPAFRIDSPLGLGIDLTTDSDITGNNYTWSFGIDGVLTTPGAVTVTGNVTGSNLVTTGTVFTDSILTTGNISTNIVFGDGIGGEPEVFMFVDDGAGNIDYLTFVLNGFIGPTLVVGERNNIPGAIGNVLTGNIIVNNDMEISGDIVGNGAISTNTGNITGGNLIATNTIYGNVDVVVGNIANASATKTRITSFGANSYIQTGNGTVGSTGNIVFAPYLDSTEKVVIDTASGNVTAQNFVGNISITGNVTGTSANVDLVAGAYEWRFDNSGNLTLPGNTFAVNYANNTPVDVVTRFEGAWTVPTGNSTQSFTVESSNSYQMWVEGNIPNGIIAWNALVTITNNNVPVLGQQFAWNYEGAGTPIALTSIPNQIVGTAGTISNAAPAVANTNVFSFGINNGSGSEQTVRYGWIRIS